MGIDLTTEIGNSASPNAKRPEGCRDAVEGDSEIDAEEIVDELKDAHTSDEDYEYVVTDDDSGPDTTHTCVHCDSEKYIEDEPRSTPSWCDDAGSVTTWVRIGSERDT